ncbi:hypothetical protein KM043_003569 [Ampulex compressa]|nr:hypothetical protein KM043_003569 [Ampulex compressa]
MLVSRRRFRLGGYSNRVSSVKKEGLRMFEGVGGSLSVWNEDMQHRLFFDIPKSTLAIFALENPTTHPFPQTQLDPRERPTSKVELSWELGFGRKLRVGGRSDCVSKLAQYRCARKEGRGEDERKDGKFLIFVEA